jgi:hypothetical protein
VPRTGSSAAQSAALLIPAMQAAREGFSLIRPPPPWTAPGTAGTKVPVAFSTEVHNQAELREKENFATKLCDRDAAATPLPMHDFSNDTADVAGVSSKSGVPGRRLLRMPPDMAPQHVFVSASEPEGPRTSSDEIEKVLTERDGTLVYLSTFQDLPRETPERLVQHLDSQPGYAKASWNGSERLPMLRPFYTPESGEDTVLVFESRFESGNLFSAHQVGPFEYDLKLRYDTNTNAHTQWFYFSVSNTRKGIPYKFNFINMLKSNSLYNYGLRPLIFSSALHREKSIGWHRAGEQIMYYGNKIYHGAAKKKGRHCYTLTFKVTFSHDKDTCFLTHCYPYTYSDLQVYLDQLELKSEYRSFMRRRTLCETEAGNKCDLLTITCRSGDDKIKQRKVVFISARVHPGETNASWIMKGCIDFLLSDDEVARQLRQNFIFKLVPMLNPDGVINGNYRCGLAGHDLNRRWTKPHPKQHPTIYHTKLTIEELMKERDVVLFCDLHGHSQKKNVFLYGCDARYWNRKLCRASPPVPFCERIFPMLLQEKSRSFALSGCRFKVQKSKASTSRVVCWQMGIHNSYTLEASFCSAEYGNNGGMHFGTPELEEIGKSICLSIHEQFSEDGAWHDSLLQRAAHQLHLDDIEEGDADSDSDNSSSDDEICEVKPKAKTGKLARKSTGCSSPAPATAAFDCFEKEVRKEPAIKDTPAPRQIPVRRHSARSVYRPGSHLRSTVSVRARTAELRRPEDMPLNDGMYLFKDRLRVVSTTAHVQGKEDPLRGKSKDCVQGQLQDDHEASGAKSAGSFEAPQRMLRSFHPWIGKVGLESDDTHQASRDPLQGLRMLQRIAERARAEASQPLRTLHPVLFDTDLPQDKASRYPTANPDMPASDRIALRGHQTRDSSPIRSIFSRHMQNFDASLPSGAGQWTPDCLSPSICSGHLRARPATAHVGASAAGKSRRKSWSPVRLSRDSPALNHRKQSSFMSLVDMNFQGVESGPLDDEGNKTDENLTTPVVCGGCGDGPIGSENAGRGLQSREDFAAQPKYQSSAPPRESPVISPVSVTSLHGIMLPRSTDVVNLRNNDAAAISSNAMTAYSPVNHKGGDGPGRKLAAPVVVKPREKAPSIPRERFHASLPSNFVGDVYVGVE